MSLGSNMDSFTWKEINCKPRPTSKQTKIATNKKPEVEGTLSSWQGTQSGRLGFLCCTLSDPAIDLVIGGIFIAVIIAQVKGDIGGGGV